MTAKEELAAIRPDLDGQQIMAILGIKPGPEVGKAYKFLLNLRLDEGPHTPDEAKKRTAGLVGHAGSLNLSDGHS
ncbi:tRNA nucleotidyltransferase [Cutibacterium acnes JCM 18916]|nr:tRNA nucleotidyltransferase [Cutibacterium acnes JCM 18916]